jgi:hypothetical protein
MTYSMKTQIAIRRERVARLRLRGLTEREIAFQLGSGENALFNPKTHKPYSNFIVHRDLEWLREQWEKEATKEIGEWKTKLIVEVEEVKRAAWAHGELETVLKCVTQQRKIMGIDAPVKIAPTSPDGEKPYESLSDEERVARLAAILDAARERGSKPPDSGA